MKNDLADPAVPLRFAGHETFPLRLLWLKKAYDVVANGGADRRTFQEQHAIARFGVGKNMALAMRHWALAAGVISDGETLMLPTKFGDMIFGEKGGLDPYLENDSTLWLIHSHLVGAPEVATTFFYAFNLLNQASFSREDLTEAVAEVVRARSGRATIDTIKRDVEVFVRSYVSRNSDTGEDASEPLLAELGLLREVRSTGQLEFVRGPKHSLSDGVFAVVLKRFWSRWHPQSPTLSVEQACYGVGSPGRIFKLDEDSLVARLMLVAEITDGAIQWTDTAGLRQVALTTQLGCVNELDLIRLSYNCAEAA
ncbi:DUF4007 family protein [Mesorhizobium sp. M0019]|uniref:DUF4007 family protein n=1 Tax=Mesorhizobium sp. M0019 TaxID=2956845 RepID=UPI00333A4129